MKSVVVAAAGLPVIAAALAISWAGDSTSRTEIESLNQAFVTAWNAHDPGKMAAVWSDADMVNPIGMKAHGRAEIEKLFDTEHHGAMKASTFKIESNSIRQISREVAVQDMDIVITGMVGPDGKALPAFRPHSFEVLVKEGGHWRVEYVRAYALQPTPAAAK
jgi:uncharacterized protein (TIGR02246 family)